MHARYYPRPRTVDELIELVELDAKRDHARAALCRAASSRRLDLALALVGDPDLLFLDEPTTGFDPHARRQAWTTIRALCELGKTVFLTTHFMDEAQALADRVAVMLDGRLVAIGPPAELGGRDAAPTEIRFGLPAGVALGPARARRRRVERARRPRLVITARRRPRPHASPAGRSSAATSCAASPSPARRSRTSTCR